MIADKCSGKENKKRRHNAAVSPRDFSSGMMWKNIIAQAIPLTVAQLISLLYNIVDRIYIGHLPDVGSMALTGIGLTFPFSTFVLACANLFGTGGAPLFSIARGSKEDERAGKIMGNTFTMILISSAIIFVICYKFRVQVLWLFGGSNATIFYAESYLRIYLFGVLFSMIVTGMNGFISALGFPRTAMWTTVIGAALNLILDPFFIYVLKLGVQGAAIATVMSQGVSALWVVKFLLGKQNEYKLTFFNMRLRIRLVREVLGLGISGFVQQFTNCVVQIVCNVTLQIYGGDIYVGVMTIINSIREIIVLPVRGLSNGAQPVLGYNFGAKKPKRVKQGISFVSIVGIIYTASMWLLVLGFPRAFVHIFSSDVQMIDLSIAAVRIYFAGFVFMGLQIIGQCVFVGLGKARKAVFFTLLRKAVIVIPLTILFAYVFGSDGVFLPSRFLILWVEWFALLLCGSLYTENCREDA